MFKLIKYKILFSLIMMVMISCNSQGRKEYKKITQKKEILKTNRKNIKNGNQAPLFELPSPSGKIIRLKNFKGKYVLIDFWASWCATCRKENKQLIPVYNRHKGKSFEIIGISLDRNKENWIKTINKYGFDWKQVSDLKGIDSEIATKYGIQYVPNFLLVSPNGIIVKKYHEDSIDELEGDLEKLMAN